VTAEGTFSIGRRRRESAPAPPQRGRPVSGWCFAPDARRPIRAAGKDPDTVRRCATEGMIEGSRTNSLALKGRMVAFQIAVIAFLLQVVALAIVLAVRGR